MVRNESRPVETIDDVRFIEMRESEFSPLVTRCVVKLMYVGQNRNGSQISREALERMAPTVRGCPIVGYWKDERYDFGDHGSVVTIEEDEIRFSCKTRPYGFVPTDADVWFQKFADDGVEHEYLVTTGYLWTGQYEELESVFDGGKGQSVELDNDTINGHWATDAASGMEFFIINDATFTKLCILGDDVEPCFEGASVTVADATNAPTRYSEDDGARFLFTLSGMMRELRDATAREGGLNMPNPTGDNAGEQFVATTATVSPEDVTESEPQEPEAEPEQLATDEPETPADEPEASADELEQPEELETPTAEDTSEQELEEAPAPEAEAAPDYALEVERLTAENAAMRAELESLREFRLNVEGREKDALIAKYFMLDDDDKADVVAHRDELTLDEIESRLAVAYVRKNVKFDLDAEVEETTELPPVMSFSLDDGVESDDSFAADPVLDALREYKSADSRF